ncbi:MAG: hypothetical protein ACLFQB_15275 [Chitinispirillaceae bacterium]
MTFPEDEWAEIPSSMNFIIWWDGNLSRELMNSNTITRWSIGDERGPENGLRNCRELTGQL